MAQLHLDTLLAQAGTRQDPRTGAVSVPIYQTATFAHPALGQSTGYDYSRTTNPTRAALEAALASVDRARKAIVFSSGLAAIDAIARLFAPGDKILVTEDLYGGTYRLFQQVLKPFGIEAVPVDTSSLAAVKAAVMAGVKGLFVESPTNPLLRVADIKGLAALSREQGWLFILDNTFMTPVLQNALDLGADISVYSATKYLSGHNDTLLGAVTTRRDDIAQRLAFLQNAVGAVPGPQDCWLVLRGLKTLSLRMQRQQANAGHISTWLKSQPWVAQVYYPGFGGMVSCEVTRPDLVPQILARVKVFIFAESLGGVESLITYPAVQTHADIPESERRRLGITDCLLRLSVGIENVDDLIKDLAQAAQKG